MMCPVPFCTLGGSSQVRLAALALAIFLCPFAIPLPLTFGFLTPTVERVHLGGSGMLLLLLRVSEAGDGMTRLAALGLLSSQ